MEIEAEVDIEVGWEFRGLMKGVNSVHGSTMAQPPNEEYGDWACLPAESKSRLVGSVRELMKREWTVCSGFDYAQATEMKRMEIERVESKLVGNVFENSWKEWTVWAVAFDWCSVQHEWKSMEIEPALPAESKSKLGWSVRELMKGVEQCAVASTSSATEWREWRLKPALPAESKSKMGWNILQVISKRKWEITQVARTKICALLSRNLSGRPIKRAMSKVTVFVHTSFSSEVKCLWAFVSRTCYM